MKSIQKGFSLIELMIVVAIIGVLVAIASPFYQDYTRRARVAEGLSLASGAKIAIADYYSAMSTFPSNNASAGLTDPTSISGPSVTSVEVTDNTITISFNTMVSTAATTLLLTATSSASGLTWSCKYPAGTLGIGLRPSSCR